MPGPGGGSRGGGGFGGGGGFRGGGFRGGGFGGGYRRGYYGGWGFGPRRYYYGGSGCLGILLLPVLLVLMAVFMITSLVGGAFGAIAEGGQLQYNERAFGTYAVSEYEDLYGAYEGYEDHILIVFLTTEEASEYYFYGCVGNHLTADVSDLFGGNGTALSRALERSVNAKDYWYSLDSNLARAVGVLADNTEAAMRGERPLTCKEADGGAPSKLVNHTEMVMDEETVNAALEDFTARTGLAISIVVEDAEDVFETVYTGMIFGLVVAAIFIAIAVLIVVRFLKGRKNGGGGADSHSGENGYNTGGYYRE